MKPIHFSVLTIVAVAALLALRPPSAVSQSTPVTPTSSDVRYEYATLESYDGKLSWFEPNEKGVEANSVTKLFALLKRSPAGGNEPTWRGLVNDRGAIGWRLHSIERSVLNDRDREVIWFERLLR